MIFRCLVSERVALSICSRERFVHALRAAGAVTVAARKAQSEGGPPGGPGGAARDTLFNFILCINALWVACPLGLARGPGPVGSSVDRARSLAIARLYAQLLL